MSGAGHTPGPWSYRSRDGDDWGVVRAPTDSSGYSPIICQARDPYCLDSDDLAIHRAEGTDPWEANARLIASAPDLLEALESIFAKLDRPYGAPGHSHLVPGIWDADNIPEKAGKECDWCALWDAARAAIHRARTGEVS